MWDEDYDEELPRSKQDRHETPSGVRYNGNNEGSGDGPHEGSRRRDGSLVDNRPLHGPHIVPDTVTEALIVCAPFQDPVQSRAEMDGTQLEGALALLTDKEAVVIDLVVFGQMSLSQAGEWLGREFGRGPYSKQGVSNIRDSALRKMKEFYEHSNV